MGEWVRRNADRLVLSAIGVVVLATGLAQPAQRDGLAVTLVVLGVGVLVLAVIFPRVKSFSVGLKGFEARLERIEQKVDQIVAVGTIQAKTEVFRPIVGQDPPPHESE